MKVNDQTTKGFLDHVEDLRWMLIRSFGALAIGMTVSLALTKPFLQVLYIPLKKAGQDPTTFLRVLGVADGLSIVIDLAISGGVLLALPFILYFIAGFLLPALTRREARALIPAFVAGAFLFVVSCFVMPTTDLVSLGTMTGALYVLFEIALVVIHFIEKKRGPLQGAGGDESDWQTG